MVAVVNKGTAENPKLGPYRIVEEVGVGGLGRVFRAIDERSGHTVALKVLHDKYTNNKRMLGIFHRELLIMAGLHHKHIVGYIDSCFEPPTCYIVTEFIDGWSGHAFMKKVGRIPPLVTLCIAIDMLQGIDYLHLHDKIHSDLSAANILLANNGRVMVTDFGLSVVRDVEDYKNYMIGTPGYYSPEHITETPIVPQTDLYNTGLLIYEMLTGIKAVPASSDRRKIMAHMKRIRFDRINLADKKMESLIKKLLRTSLQPNVGKRFETADKMMFACYEILKRYNIRYARHAIKKYIIDVGLMRGPYAGSEQNIYVGYKS